MEFTINIGLLSNPLTANEIADHLRELNGYKVLEYKVNSDSCYGFIGTTFVVKLKTDYKLLSKVINTIENLCCTFEQNCIAVSADNFDLLVYSIRYTGIKNKFDNDFFITV